MAMVIVNSFCNGKDMNLIFFVFVRLCKFQEIY